MKVSKKVFLFFSAIAIGAGIGIGYCVGYFSKTGSQSNEPDAKVEHASGRPSQNINSKEILLSSIKAENIRNNLRELTRHPHLAGTPADLEQAEYLKQFWDDNGLDRTALYPYDVLLSYPCDQHPNKIELFDENNEAVFTSQLHEKVLMPEQNQSDVVRPFNAYSASGTPIGDLVYVNYGRIEDFYKLQNGFDENESSSSIDLSGKVCIARYGEIYRGNKAKLAEEYGCIGLILYSDPEDVTEEGAGTYPDSLYMPASGVQRGSLKTSDYFGDPMTEGYPSIESAYRKSIDQLDLPKIPVHPISYGDAEILLGNMTGREVPESWRGGLNITYRLGPGFLNPQWKVKMSIMVHIEKRTTYNVMGFIRGKEEPDRYVLVGNHRDSWVFGGIDPSSATAAMMELSRAFGSLLKTGWRPRRTIVFCSWGAEEYGLIGSSEWVEDYNKILSERAVAYLNCDLAIVGNVSFGASGMPIMYNVMREAAKQIPNPNPEEVIKGRNCIYETWTRNCFIDTGDGNKVPRIRDPGTGSDHGPFIGITGVPSLMIWYGHGRGCKFLSYPLYHSAYESFHLVETYYDPGFDYHKAIAQYWGELTRRLAEPDLLPFNVTDYAVSIRPNVQQFENVFGTYLDNYNFTNAREHFQRAADKFLMSSKAFEKRLMDDSTKINNPLRLRMYNDQMMKLERVFIDPKGLPGRSTIRHVVFAPSMHNMYAGATFSGLYDSLFELMHEADESERAAKEEVVAQQFATVTYFVGAAAAYLEDSIKF